MWRLPGFMKFLGGIQMGHLLKIKKQKLWRAAICFAKAKVIRMRNSVFQSMVLIYGPDKNEEKNKNSDGNKLCVAL